MQPAGWPWIRPAPGWWIWEERPCIPGLSDAHTHISWPLDFVFDHDGVAASSPQRHILDVAAVSRTFLESGYTLIIGAGVLQPEDDVVMKDFIDRGLMAGPRIVPSGPMVTEPGALGADAGLMDVANGAEEMRRIVARQCDAGVRAVKLFISGDGIMPQFPSEDTYMNDDMLRRGRRGGRQVTEPSSPPTPVARGAWPWRPGRACS